mmetsp:Transcript_63549/g.148219  ORF Transcript_63549/g.148219 Transcript_63549/m.148219 type:complete len:847 (+) Transcript_63549:51-2591(+)
MLFSFVSRNQGVDEPASHVRVPKQELRECLQRLTEAEGHLKAVRNAEEALNRARDALAHLCQPTNSPTSTPCPTVHSEEAQLSPATPCSATARSEVSQTAKPGVEHHLLDQVIIMTADADDSSVVRYDSSPSALRAAKRREEQQRTWNSDDIRRGFVPQKCCNACWVPVLFPDCRYLIVWDLLCLLFIIFETFALPLWLAFDVHPTGPTFYFVSFVNLYFIVDIPTNFFRGFKTESGRVVMSPWRIARRYIKWLPLDILAGIPWEWIHTATGSRGDSWTQLTKLLRLLRVARLLRLLRLNFLPQSATIFIESSAWLTFIQGVVRVVFFLFGITHCSACIWFCIGSRSDTDQTWITAKLPGDADFWVEYIYSLYFTLTTMTTVGYGDITPQNEDEVFFTTVLLLVATVVFASLMGALTDLICNLHSETNSKDARVRMLCHYMNWRNVPQDLFKAVRKHMLHLWETNKGYDAYEEDVKQNLPPVLQKELSFHLYGHMLRKLPFLAWLWDYEACLKDIANDLRAIILSRADRIFKRGRPNVDIFVLRSGSVRLSLNERLHAKADDVKSALDEDLLDDLSEEDSSRSLAVPSPSINGLPSGSPFHRLVANAIEERRFGEGEEDALPMQQNCSDDFPVSKALRDAVRSLKRQDYRQRAAAHHIQKVWHAKKSRSSSSPRPSIHRHSITSKSVEAPAFFGEACLWVPFETWDSEDSFPTYSYTAHCEEVSELLIISRAQIRELILLFSPWLKERFECFRECVVDGMAKQTHIPEDKPVSSFLPKQEGGRPTLASERAQEICRQATHRLTRLATTSREHASQLAGPLQERSNGGTWATLRHPLLCRPGQWTGE